MQTIVNFSGGKDSIADPFDLDELLREKHILQEEKAGKTDTDCEQLGFSFDGDPTKLDVETLNKRHPGILFQ